MFTGIVEELGARRPTGRATGSAIACRLVLDDVTLGASIAVNGFCLTVVAFDDRLVGRRRDRRDVEAHEPRRPQPSATRSTSSGRSACRDRLGGHLVQGHVDGVGEIVEPAPDLRVRCDRDCCATSSRRARSPSTGSASPSSSRSTTASRSPSSRTPPRSRRSVTRVRGGRVNLEVDVTAKYVERLLSVEARADRGSGAGTSIERRPVAAIGRGRDRRRRRRRGPRERGRPHHGGRVRHAASRSPSSSSTRRA